MPRYNFCVLYAIVIVKTGQDLKMIPQNNQNTVKYINNDQFYSSRQVWGGETLYLLELSDFGAEILDHRFGVGVPEA